MELVCRCHAPGCSKRAKWVLGFRVWPIGKPRSARHQIEGMGDCVVCDEHAIRDPEAFFTPKMKEKIAAQLFKAGLGFPDFSDAQVMHTEIGEDGDNAEISQGQAQRLGGSANVLH